MGSKEREGVRKGRELEEKGKGGSKDREGAHEKGGRERELAIASRGKGRGSWSIVIISFHD